MKYWPTCKRVCGNAAAALGLLAIAIAGAAPALADPTNKQTDPALKAVVSQAIASGECFPDKYEAAVWYKLMEPRIRNKVKDHNDRIEILKHVYCEAAKHKLPPDLVMAVIDVESSFNHWAVSYAGAQGLMQVMPFWPKELGMKRNQLLTIEFNIRMGCAILRHYYDREKSDLRKALARYNGSVGKREYPDLVLNRWSTRWRR